MTIVISRTYTRIRVAYAHNKTLCFVDHETFSICRCYFKVNGRRGPSKGEVRNSIQVKGEEVLPTLVGDERTK